MALAELAEQLQIDQLEIIERNRVHEGQELKILGAIGEGKAPTSVPSAASCALEEILRQGREMIQWSSPKSQEGDWRTGRGVAIIMQKSGIPDIDQANCMIKLESDGTFIVHSGGADIGTGLDTVVTKLAAEVLHCPPQDVHVISGDTDHALFDKGAYASSGTCFSGNAARMAAENLREKILFHGAQMLDEPLEDVQLATPVSFVVRKAKSVSGILPIKAKPVLVLVRWWEQPATSRLISPFRMAQTLLKLPSTRVPVKSAWTNSTHCWIAVRQLTQS